MKHYRNVHGRFVGRGEMLFNWLPVLLSWSYHDALQIALKVMIRFCETELAQELAITAGQIERQEQPVEAEVFLWGVKRSERWQARRNALRDALRKIQEIGS